MMGDVGGVYSIWASQLKRYKLLWRVFGGLNEGSKKFGVDRMLAQMIHGTTDTAIEVSVRIDYLELA